LHEWLQYLVLDRRGGCFGDLCRNWSRHSPNGIDWSNVAGFLSGWFGEHGCCVLTALSIASLRHEHVALNLVAAFS
jgi:hypothetical protein